MAEGNTGFSQSRLLDEIDCNASLFYASSVLQPSWGSYWSNDAIGDLRDQSATSFLTFAIESGHERYVWWLSHITAEQFAVSDRSRFIIPERSYDRDFELPVTRPINGTQLQNRKTGMVRMLLTREADPTRLMAVTLSGSLFSKPLIDRQNAPIKKRV